MLKLSPQDSYFAIGGVFAQKYRTYISAPILAEHITTVINGRAPECLAAFGKSIVSLDTALSQDSTAKTAFMDILDNVRADGLVEMVLRKEFHHQYHIVEHAAEVSDDAGQVLSLEFNQFSTTSLLIKEIIIGLAKACAAWHDVVQNQGSPKNEIESAKYFMHRLDFLLDEFKDNFPMLREAVQLFQKQLPFISNELIIYNTWLVVGIESEKKLIFKSLRAHAEQVINDFNEVSISSNPYWELLSKAGEVICQADTKRYQFKHVIDAEVMVTALNQFPNEERKVLEDFFNLTEINTNQAKEEFLGLSCQNLRIFPEMNRPDIEGTPIFSVTNISQEDFNEFVLAFEKARIGNSDQINFEKIFNIFINTKNKAGKDNLLRELEFAKAQHHDLWRRHSIYLEKFTHYVRDESFTANKKTDLMKILTLLATRFQPGNLILQSDKKFRQRLQEAAKINLRKQVPDNLSSVIERYS